MELYANIGRQNRTKYGTEFEKVLRIVINQYSDRTHFIYEILQNAEDADAKHIRFSLERDRLLVFHNGRPFNEKDIEGVCGIASGTKEDGTRIGHFGIGFKSVYCYTERPYIYSGKYHFAIKNQLFPEEVSAMSGLPDTETCIVIPFNREDVSGAVAFAEIRDVERFLKSANTSFCELCESVYNSVIVNYCCLLRTELWKREDTNG